MPGANTQVAQESELGPGRAEVVAGFGGDPASGEASFDEIFRAYSPRVRRLAQVITGSVDTAEDVTQEVFLRHWVRQAAFDPSRGPLWAWLNMLTHAAAVDWVRREAAFRAREPRCADRSQRTTVVADGFGQVEACLVVHDALAALPAGERDAIESAYLHQRTFREVAVVLGIPEGTAKSRIRVGMTRLRDCHDLVA